jgi:hypothetical protein
MNDPDTCRYLWHVCASQRADVLPELSGSDLSVEMHDGDGLSEQGPGFPGPGKIERVLQNRLEIPLDGPIIIELRPWVQTTHAWNHVRNLSWLGSGTCETRTLSVPCGAPARNRQPGAAIPRATAGRVRALSRRGSGTTDLGVHPRAGTAAREAGRLPGATRHRRDRRARQPSGIAGAQPVLPLVADDLHDLPRCPPAAKPKKPWIQSRAMETKRRYDHTGGIGRKSPGGLAGAGAACLRSRWNVRARERIGAGDRSWCPRARGSRLPAGYRPHRLLARLMSGYMAFGSTTTPTMGLVACTRAVKRVPRFHISTG